MILADESKRLTMKFLSTPSGWRATKTGFPSSQDSFISIHALRVEGDNPSLRAKSERYISIHALRVEGDLRRQLITDYWPISIHALRVEGDELLVSSAAFTGEFLSTPSGWRATSTGRCRRRRRSGFLSTPSGWRATVLRHVCRVNVARISIHALRVEGDRVRRLFCKHHRDFYPRPPGGGRPKLGVSFTVHRPISIHALRVEGDVEPNAKEFPAVSDFYPRPPGGGRRVACEQRRFHGRISIHALRVEGDGRQNRKRKRWCYFYPRPPGGGRPWGWGQDELTILDFYPRPPGGGRPATSKMCRVSIDFYPRPPGGGRQLYSDTK